MSMNYFGCWWRIKANHSNTANSSRQSGDHTAAVNPTLFESLSLSFERRLNLTLDIPSSLALTRGSATVSSLHRPSYLPRLLKIVGEGMSSDLIGLRREVWMSVKEAPI